MSKHVYSFVLVSIFLNHYSLCSHTEQSYSALIGEKQTLGRQEIVVKHVTYVVTKKGV